MAALHELRNRLATATLTVAAMIDGKLEATRRNLQHLGQTWADVEAIVRSARDGDWGHRVRLVELSELATLACDGAMVQAAAADVKLEVVPASLAACSAFRGDARAIVSKIDAALREAIADAPAHGAIELEAIAPQSLEIRLAGLLESDENVLTFAGTPVCTCREQ